jgi:hypothetical protein
MIFVNASDASVTRTLKNTTAYEPFSARAAAALELKANLNKEFSKTKTDRLLKLRRKLKQRVLENISVDLFFSY